MKKITTIGFLFFTIIGISQTYQDNIVINEKVYDIVAIKKTTSEINISIAKNGTSKKKDFTLKELKLGTFSTLFVQNIKALNSSDVTETAIMVNNETVLDSTATSESILISPSVDNMPSSESLVHPEDTADSSGVSPETDISGSTDSENSEDLDSLNVSESLGTEDSTDLSDDVSAAKAIADKVFYSITFAFLQQSFDEAPPAGTIKIGDELPLWIEYNDRDFKKNSEKNEIYKHLVKNKSKEVGGNGLMGLGLKDTSDFAKNKRYSVGTFKIIDVTIEFYEGFIENIVVYGKINITNLSETTPAILKSYHGKNYGFTNKNAIGFQTSNNYNRLSDTRLFDPVDDNIPLGIYLSEVFEYKHNLALLRKDYSPANGVVELKSGETKVLRKSPLSKIFEVKVFSDFLGFDQGTPNGILQSELAYRFNFSNRRHQSKKTFSWLFDGYGIAQYLRISGGLTKIEDDERFLIPETVNTISGEGENQAIERTLSTNPIELLRHQNWNVGFDLNAFYVEDSDLKYHWYLDLGYRYARTQVRDSLVEINEIGEVEKNGKVNDFGIGYNTYFLKTHIDLLPNENFSFAMNYKLSYITPAFNQIELKTVDRSEKKETPFKRWYNTYELSGRTRLGNAGNIFVRYRFNYQNGNVENNFHQFQVGYSFYLFKRVKSKPKNDAPQIILN